MSNGGPGLIGDEIWTAVISPVCFFCTYCTLRKPYGYTQLTNHMIKTSPVASNIIMYGSRVVCRSVDRQKLS